MKHLITKGRAALLLALLLCVLPAAALPARAPAVQAGDGATGYTLAWSTVDGGGQTFSTGDGYALGATLGQPDAGTASGGGYTLAGGFWGGGAEGYRIYLPVVLRGF